MTHRYVSLLETFPEHSFEHAPQDSGLINMQPCGPHCACTFMEHRSMCTPAMSTCTFESPYPVALSSLVLGPLLSRESCQPGL